MQILLSNDDGVYAPGLQILHHALSQFYTVTVVAPDCDRSAASKSLTLNMPLRSRRLENGFIAVNGTPTDCVHLGLSDGFTESSPQMVIAGINQGANLGDDVLYSGTVSAATEGRFLGRPAIAVSLVGTTYQHYETAASVVLNVLLALKKDPLPSDTILNINVPDCPLEALKGILVCRLGQRDPSDKMIKSKDPRGQTVYWVGPAGAEQDAGEGTDFHAVKQGFVAVTPLQMDLTRYDVLERVSKWVDNIPEYAPSMP
jgi:5'-nucleotidase